MRKTNRIFRNQGITMGIVMLAGVMGGMGTVFAADPFSEDPKELVRSCMSSVRNQCEKWAEKGGGSGNPKGLTNEVAVELAMGERYMMFGTVVVYRNQVLLEIDFNQHPWLKNRRRVMNPNYRIDAQDLEKWKKLNRKYVSFPAIAQGMLFVDEQGRKNFDVVLQPTDAPTEGLRR